MPLQSVFLSGSPRLEQAATTGPSMKEGEPDHAAVRRLQKALVALGYPLPRSFPGGATAEPDGLYGGETAGAVLQFQRKAFPGSPSEWDGRAGPKTLPKMDAILPKRAGPLPPAPDPVSYVCGPDVTAQIAAIWTRIQNEFRTRGWINKVRACNTILIPVKMPDDPAAVIRALLKLDLRSAATKFADINGWDTLPLFQGDSDWLRTPPVYDPAKNGPCATPHGTIRSPADPFDPGWEEECGDTVQVSGQCWLNGSVNYGTFGIMVRLCNDFARSDLVLKGVPAVQLAYTLPWALDLIKTYKRYRPSKDPTDLPSALAWTEATYRSGPSGVPTMSGNRSKCKCTCPCTGSVRTTWDYVWEPVKPRILPVR